MVCQVGPPCDVRGRGPVLLAEPPQISARGSLSAHVSQCEEGAGSRRDWGTGLAYGHLIPGPCWLGFHSGRLVRLQPWVHTVRSGSETLKDYGKGIIHRRPDRSPKGNVSETLRGGGSMKSPERWSHRPRPRMWSLYLDRLHGLGKLTEESRSTK